MKNMWLWIVIVIIVMGGVYFMTKKPAADTLREENPAMMESAVILSTQNDSGESGTATLTEEGGNVKVTVSLIGAPASAQPAHIHAGACPTPSEVVYPLTNVVNGMSETVLDTTLANLKSQMPMAINVHQSADEIGVYVACGDVAL